MNPERAHGAWRPAILLLVLAVASPAVVPALQVAAAAPAPSQAETLGRTLARVEELIAQGDERRALDLLLATFEQRHGAALEDLGLMAELALRLWLHSDAVIIAQEAFVRESISLTPEALERPAVRRLARVYAQGLYVDARSLEEAVAMPEGVSPEEMTRDERISAAEEVLRRLTAGGTDDADDFYWLAAVLVEEGEPAQARSALERHQERRPPGEALEGAARVERCLASWSTKVDLETGDRPAATEQEPGDEGRPEVEPPRRIQPITPRYTEAARRARVQGVVTLEMVIDEQGWTTCIRPVRGLPFGLTEMAVVAASQGRFDPAQLDGEPVPVQYRLDVAFRLD